MKISYKHHEITTNSKDQFEKLNFKKLANPMIANLTPYQPGASAQELPKNHKIKDVLKLASNENPIGASQLALQAAQYALINCHYYPDSNGHDLKFTLGSFLKVMPEQLTLGNGSENIFDLICKAFLNQDNSAVVSQYCFIAIPLAIQISGAKINVAPAKDYAHSITNIISAINTKTRIIFLVNPNNPTGTYITELELRHFLKSISSDILVVLDEAYCEYVDYSDYPNSLKLLEKYPNLIITRTFSKIYGLSGLRIGYAISNPDITEILNRVRLPFNVNCRMLKTL